MYKNSALLSIGAALLFSLFFVDVGHAFQIDRKQNSRQGNERTANLSTTSIEYAKSLY